MGDYTSTDYPLGFADQNTGAVETQGAVDNTKYAYVMDEGYLRMMTLKERAKSGNGGKVWGLGTSAFYSCKFMRGNANSTEWPSSNIRIYPGMRIETRARMLKDSKSINTIKILTVLVFPYTILLYGAPACTTCLFILNLSKNSYSCLFPFYPEMFCKDKVFILNHQKKSNFF